MNQVVIFYGKNKRETVDLDSLLSISTECIRGITFQRAASTPGFIKALENVVGMAVSSTTFDEAVNILMDMKTEETQNSTDEAAKETINKNLKEKEDVTMKDNIENNNIFEEVWEEVEEELNSTEETTAEEQVSDAGKMADKAVGLFHSFLDGLDTVLGMRGLKLQITSIWMSGHGGNKATLKLMAEESKRIIDERVEYLKSCKDEDSIRQAIKLEKYTTDVNGKSIFDSFIVLLIWITNRLAKKVKTWTNVDINNKLINALVKALKTGIKVLNAGVKLVTSSIKAALCYGIAGVFKLVDFIYKAFKAVIDKVNGWVDVAKQKFSKNPEVVD